MSSENVELVRRGYEAFNRRDKSLFDELVAEHLEVHPVPEWPENTVIRGRDAAWDFFVANEAVWVPGEYEIFEVIDAEAAVYADVGHTVTGAGSGVPVELRFHGAFRFESGRLSRVDFFLDRERALAAAGLA